MLGLGAAAAAAPAAAGAAAAGALAAAFGAAAGAGAWRATVGDWRPIERLPPIGRAATSATIDIVVTAIIMPTKNFFIVSS
jgi:hypothetical protein